MSAITAKASRKMKKYAVLTREPRCFLGSFDFSWEQRKLGEMGQTYTGLSGKTKDDFGHGQARFVTYMNVFSNPISNPEMTEPIEIDPKQNEVEVGDVFFTTSSETPEEVGMSSILLEKRGKTYLNSFCFGFRPSEKIDSYYLAYMLRSESTRAKIILLAQGISRYNISKNKVMEIAVSLPSLDEQKMIGQYFSQLDNLITLHQRKCANLCSPSQVVFSLLFATSTFSWEQRKVSELFRVTRGYVLAATQTETTKTDEKPYPVYSSQTKDKGLMGYYKDYLYEDAITWTTDGANAGTVNYRAGKFYCTNVCGVLLSNEVKANQMIAEALNSVAKGYVSYVGNPKLMNNVMADIVIQIPTQAEEREQLSSFFAKLDNLITLHQRECISFTGRADRLILTANKKRTTSSWEQRKFEEIAVRSSVICSDDTLPRVEYEDIVSGTGRLNKDIYAKQSIKSGIAFHQGDVLYGKLRPYLQNWLLPTFDGLAVGDFWVLQPQNADSSFLYRLIQSRQFDEVANQSTGTKMPRADWKLVSKTVFSIPSNISEQAAIGTYFTALDSLITLHQRKPFLMKWRTSDANRNQTNRLVL